MAADSKKGSAIVEAAMVLPVVILIIAAIIDCGLQLYSNVKISSENHIAEADADIEGKELDVPDILRTGWVFK